MALEAGRGGEMMDWYKEDKQTQNSCFMGSVSSSVVESVLSIYEVLDLIPRITRKKEKKKGSVAWDFVNMLNTYKC